jgi:hypothetical protein
MPGIRKNGHCVPITELLPAIAIYAMENGITLQDRWFSSYTKDRQKKQ